MTFHADASPLLLSGVKPVGFGKGVPQEATDILIGADGNIAGVGASLASPEGARRIDAKGAYVSPGWGTRLTKTAQIGLHIFYS